VQHRGAAIAPQGVEGRRRHLRSAPRRAGTKGDARGRRRTDPSCRSVSGFVVIRREAGSRGARRIVGGRNPGQRPLPTCWSGGVPSAIAGALVPRHRHRRRRPPRRQEPTA
jgi:hypothetical protein